MSIVPTNWRELDSSKLVDYIGLLAHEEKQVAEMRKALGKELIARNVLPCSGMAFDAKLISGGFSYRLDKEKVTAEMGEPWVMKRSKRSTREAYVQTEVRFDAAQRILADAAE